MLLAVGVLHARGRLLVEGLLEENVRKTARAHAVDLDAFLDEVRENMRRVDPQDIGALRRSVDDDPRVLAIMRVDRSGELLEATLPQTALAPWAVEACSDLVNRPNQPMTHAGEGHAHEVVVAVPLADGVLCSQLSFTLHQVLLTERTRSLIEGTAYIVDRAGQVVCHAFEEDEPHISRGATLHGHARAIATEATSWSGTIDEGEEVAFAAYEPARGLPWGVWVEVPASKAAAPLSSWLQQVLVLAGLLVLGTSLLAVSLVRRLVAPLGELAVAARTIARGDYGDAVPVSGEDEVAELAREFNHMSATLAESYARLDERVVQRTRELQSAREFSDLLLDTMQECILVIDPQLRVLRANKTALSTYGEDILGRQCTAVHGDGSAQCLSAAVLRSGAPQQAERVVEHDAGARVYEVESYPVLGEDGDVDVIVEMARDVTEVKAAQSRLLHQEKMAALGTLAAGMAHEIGNPLASLSSEVELMERSVDPRELKQSLPVLRDQIRRMAKLLRELVELGRPSSDELRRHRPEALLEDVARLLRHDPRASRVDIIAHAEEDLPALCTSRDRVLQILLNLGFNALDAMRSVERGRLQFRAVATGAGVCLQVEDDGPGVSTEVASRIFEPFFTTKAPGEGTGLGLFVSSRIAESLGGRLELAETDHAGARLDLLLPLCACKRCPGGCDA
ncbi:MAG: PAS domain-containing protein [Alphaproteobacteria bacterium]|nr:PAS domain-containing protein [Alphaproteobacteria bacterium]